MRKDEFPLIEAYADSKVNEVLDKIRAEIKELQPYFHEMLILDEVMQIIDKYKAEGSDKA